MEWTYLNARNTPAPIASASGNGTTAMTYHYGYYLYNYSSSGSPVALSTNGVDWAFSSYLAPTDTRFTAVAYGNGIFVVAGNGGVIARSTNGVDWVRSGNTNADFALLGAAYGNGRYVFVGSTIYTTTNLVDFERNDEGYDYQPGFNSVVYGAGLFAAGGAGGTLIWSSDGSTWSHCANSAEATINSIAHGAGRFIAMGLNGVTMTSTDANHWQPVNSGTTQAIKQVTYGGGMFVAVGPVGIVLTSQDGLNWTSRSTGLTGILSGVSYGDNRFIAVGQFGSVITSQDGVNWTRLNIGASNSFVGNSYGGGLFIAASGASTLHGYTLFVSFDGERWTETMYSSPQRLVNVTFFNNTFILLLKNFLRLKDAAILQSDPITRLYLSISSAQNHEAMEILSRGGEAGRSYQLQANSNLVSTTWTTIGSFVQTNTTTRVTVPANTQPQTFYRAVRN